MPDPSLRITVANGRIAETVTIGSWEFLITHNPAVDMHIVYIGPCGTGSFRYNTTLMLIRGSVLGEIHPEISERARSLGSWTQV